MPEHEDFISTKYDAEHISRYYDDYAEREWERFAPDADVAHMVSFHVHNHYLQRYVRPGDHILEVGAGPGRFTIEIAQLGATVTVGDISPRQLELNQSHVQDAGYAHAVVGWERLDVLDLAGLPSQSYDAVVCYGGAISYVLDQADAAIGELLRVTKPNGYLLFSVMSLLGSTRAFLAGILKVADQYGLEPIERIQHTGDLYGEVAHGHHCHMFRWSELQALLNKHPCKIVAASASNFLSLRNEETLQSITGNPTMLKAFLDWEIEYCREPGALDGGTHIILVVQRT